VATDPALAAYPGLASAVLMLAEQERAAFLEKT
jgi:hypothetical protein